MNLKSQQTHADIDSPHGKILCKYLIEILK